MFQRSGLQCLLLGVILWAVPSHAGSAYPPEPTPFDHTHAQNDADCAHDFSDPQHELATPWQQRLSREWSSYRSFRIARGG